MISHILLIQSVFKNHYCTRLISRHTEITINVLGKDDKYYWDIIGSYAFGLERNSC